MRTHIPSTALLARFDFTQSSADNSRELRDRIAAVSTCFSPPSNPHLLDRLRDARVTEPDSSVRLHLLTWETKLSFRLGLSSSLRGLIANSIRAWRSVGRTTQANRFEILTFIPQYRLLDGDPDRALQSCDLLERWGKRFGREGAIAASCLMRGVILLHQGMAGKAIRNLERARVIVDWDLGNRAGLAYCLLMEAAAWRAIGDLGISRSRGIQARDLSHAIEEIALLASTAQSLGSLYASTGEMPKSVDHYKIARAVFEKSGDTQRLFRALLGLVFSSSRLGAPEGVERLKALAEVSPTSIAKRDLGLMYEYLADAALALDPTSPRALGLYRHALGSAISCGATSNRLEVHRRIAEFWVERGNAHYASLHLGRAQALRSDGTEAEDNHALDRIEQELLWLNGDSKPALEVLKEHAQRMADLGFGYENLLTSRRVVTIADSLGDSATASEWWARTEFVADACGALPLLERWRDERQRQGYGSAAAASEDVPATTGKASTQHPFPEDIPPVNLAEFGIITRCRSLQDQGGWLARIAPTGLPILIRGESGTGKELFAKLVHDLSPRKDNAFLAVNCAALPGEIMESELYGHRRGAFTGAMSDKPGLFMLADNGTLFLDEIGEMAPALQAKLLRTLESGELRPVGDTRTHRVDVRIVAATNVNLEAAVAKGKFREDLYYRLRGFEISLPPLRDRLEDVEPLARFFLDRANRRHGKSLTLPLATAQWLMGHPWPGNVRELKFTVEQAVGLAGRTSALVPGHFIASRHTAPAQRSLPEELEEIERSRIQGALRVTDWSVAEAARLLGMSRTTLSGKLKRLGLERPGG